MKKILFILILAVLFGAPAFAADNTHSTNVELDDSEHWSRPDEAVLDITGDLSIELWWRPETLPSLEDDRYTMAAKYSDVTGNRSWTLEYNKIGNALNYRFIVSDDGTLQTVETYQVTETAGTWVHIVVTYDASAGAVEWYRNGSTVQSDTGAKLSIFNGNLDFTIGASAQPGIYADGDFDEVRLWDDIRTSTEISDNRLKCLVGDEANLVGYWRFDNDAGVDQTSNSLDLTANNSPTFTTSTPFDDSSCGAVVAPVPKGGPILF